jgi:hypothetical protein
MSVGLLSSLLDDALSVPPRRPSFMAVHSGQVRDRDAHAAAARDQRDRRVVAVVAGVQGAHGRGPPGPVLAVVAVLCGDERVVVEEGEPLLDHRIAAAGNGAASEAAGTEGQVRRPVRPEAADQAHFVPGELLSVPEAARDHESAAAVADHHLRRLASGELRAGPQRQTAAAEAKVGVTVCRKPDECHPIRPLARHVEPDRYADPPVGEG